MDCTVILDWKFIVALGAATVGVVFAVKMSPTDAKEVSIYAIDTCKEFAVALNGNC